MRQIIIWYFTITFLFSSLYLTEQLNSVGNIIVATLILFPLPFILIFKDARYDFFQSTSVIMYLFVFFCVIAALFNSDILLIIESIIIFVLFLVSFIIMPTLINNKVINEIVFKAIFLSHIPIIFIPFFLDGIQNNSYMGIFYNSNSFGTVVVTMFAALYSLLLFQVEKHFMTEKANKKNILLVIGQLSLLLFLLFLTLLSGSRTSFISIGMLLVVGISILIILIVKNKKLGLLIKKAPIYVLFSTILLIIIMKYTLIGEYFYLNIINKFKRKSNDLLDNRGETWIQTIKDTNLFGNGSNFFIENTNVSAHNTLISVLGEYGWISLFFFILFFIVITYKSIIYSLVNKDDQYKFLPLMLLTCFITLSMGENMLFKLSMLSLFFSLGSVVKNKLFNNRLAAKQSPL